MTEPAPGATPDHSAMDGALSGADTARTFKSLLFTIIMVVFSIVVIVSAQSFTWEARLLPMFFGVPMLVLSLVELLRSVAHLRTAAGTTSTAPTSADENESRHPLLWFAALSVLVLLLGLTIGGAIFLTALLLLHSRVPTWKAVLVGVGGGALYHLLIVELLAARTYPGMFGI